MRSSRGARTAVLAIVVVALGVFLSACGGGGDSTSGEEGSGGDSAGTPVKGGILKFARSQDVDVGLNPINAPSNGSIFVIQQIFDQLVEIAGGNEVVPGLATKWESSADGLTWTFHLRDAKFSNGEPVTGEDVKFSIEQFADPKINVNYSTLGESIKDVEVVDPKTVKVNLDHVDASFLDNISMFAAAILPKKEYEKIGEKEFSEQAGRHRSVQTEGIRPRPEDGARTQPDVLAQRPAVSRRNRLRIRPRRQHPGAENPLRRSRSRRRHPLQPGGVAGRRRRGRSPGRQGPQAGRRSSSTRRRSRCRTRRSDRRSTTRPRRNRSSNRVYFGNAEIANSNIPPLKYWDESLAAYPFDIEKAEELMAESSAPKGFDLEIVIPSADPVEQQVVEILKQEWAKIGVKVNIVQRDFGAMFSEWLEGKGGMATTFPGGRALQRHALRRRDRGDHARPEAGLHALGTYYNNPKVNKLIKEAKGTLDEDKRAEDFAEVQKIAPGRRAGGAAVLHQERDRGAGQCEELPDLPDRLVADAGSLAGTVMS